MAVSKLDITEYVSNVVYQEAIDSFIREFEKQGIDLNPDTIECEIDIDYHPMYLATLINVCLKAQDTSGVLKHFVYSRLFNVT